MTAHEVARTLVKSPPELWEVCSDADALGRHLAPFGEIKITRLEPESTVAWEGERASGTVRIEPSGWGTKVTLTAEAAGGDEPVAAPVAKLATEPPATLLVARPRRRGFVAWVTELIRGPELEPAVPAAKALATPVEPPEPPEPLGPVEPAEPEPAAKLDSPSGEEPALDASAALDAALESLGQAHHRPYSRG